MKNKMLAAFLIGVFLFSYVFNVALADTCSKCHGTGKITVRKVCPTCQGSSAASANIVKKGTLAGVGPSSGGPSTCVTGLFHNEESVGVYGTVTAQVKTNTETFTNTSPSTYFPPNEDVSVIVTVPGVEYKPYWSCTIKVSQVNSVDCADCGGSGYVSELVTCPDCSGTGVVAGFAGGFTNLEGVGSIVIGVAVLGSVVAGGVVLMKKRRVTEESLRRLTSFEFQDWVMKRLSATSSAERESYLGIDAYTAEGYPIQIRQEDDVGKRAIDSFAVAMGRSKARNGTIVAFSFGKDAFEGIMKARLNRLEIKQITVRELLGSRERAI